MKSILMILFFTTTLSITHVDAQKIARVSITTTASVPDALEKCKEAGKTMKYGSKDFDVNTGKITLWKNYTGGNDHELQLLITTEVKDGKTVLTIRMPHLPNTMGSYIKEVKKFVDKLTLPGEQIGEYFEGIE